MEQKNKFFEKLNEKENKLRCKFGSNRVYSRRVSCEKLAKIRRIVSNYSNCITPLILKQKPRLIIEKVSFKKPGRTKSCGFTNIQNQLKINKIDLQYSKFNLRYLKDEIDEDELKNCMRTPDDSWKSTKYRFANQLSIGKEPEGSIRSKDILTVDTSSKHHEILSHNIYSTNKIRCKPKRSPSAITIRFQ